MPTDLTPDRRASTGASLPPALPALAVANGQLIDQALDLAAHFLGWRTPDYEVLVGPHLRHVIEHLEALCLRPVSLVVDYDLRPRDADLAQRPELAIARLSRLRGQLAALTPAQLDQPLVVRGQTGLTGQLHFAAASSVGRELAFLASHTVHHFALLRAHVERMGWPAPAHFGQAPATVAHALGARPAPLTPAAA